MPGFFISHRWICPVIFSSRTNLGLYSEYKPSCQAMVNELNETGLYLRNDIGLPTHINVSVSTGSIWHIVHKHYASMATNKVECKK